MQSFSAQAKLIYNPELRFRNEGTRCIAYSIDDFFFSPDHVTVLLPQEVIMLLLFDGEHTLEETAQNMAYVFGIQDAPEQNGTEPPISLTQGLKNSIEALEKRMNFSPLVMDAAELAPALLKQTQERYPDPGAFIIPKDRIVFDPRDLRLNQPLSVNYNVMTSCGFRCKYCYHPLVAVPDLIPLKRLDTVFTELKGMGCESVMLTGGDPMLRPDIDELMQSLYRHGWLYSLSTKSVISAERIKKLHETAGLRGMQISLDSADSETVQYLLGIKNGDYHRNVIKMIQNLQANDIEVRVKAVYSQRK